MYKLKVKAIMLWFAHYNAYQGIPNFSNQFPKYFSCQWRFYKSFIILFYKSCYFLWWIKGVWLNPLNWKKKKMKLNIPTWSQNAENPIFWTSILWKIFRGVIFPDTLQWTTCRRSYLKPPLKSCIRPRFCMYCMFSCSFGT